MNNEFSGIQEAFANGRGLNRRDFLRMSSVGLAGTALFGAAGPAVGQTEKSALSLGIKPSNTGGRNRRRLIAALTGSSDSITFPRGKYRINNSGEYVIIRNFSGKITMEDGARFVFTDNTTRGLMFEKGVGAQFHGLKTSFAVLPPARETAQVCILFIDTLDTVVRDVNINRSAGAGMLFARCVRPSVSRAVIKNTRGDGLHFSNCQDASVSGLYTKNTGDDGLAFLNYAGGPDYSGGTADDITVVNSFARGITVVGQRDVTIQNFSVDRTKGPGIYCARESARWSTRTPSNVRFAGGVVSRAGRADENPANKYGIEFSNVGSVEFENIDVSEPASRGVSGVAPDGSVRLSNIRASYIPAAGFHLSAADLVLDRLIASEADGTGIAILGSGSVKYGALKTVNVAKRDTARRAFNFENNATVEGVDLAVSDTQPVATGYTVRTYGLQAGTMGKVRDLVRSRNLRFQNESRLAMI